MQVAERVAPGDRPWVAVCAVLMLLGVVLRVAFVEFPARIVYDESHFVENARNYLAHRADWNDHPPLGKLIIAASMTVFGDRPMGWRFPALVYGFTSLLLGAWLAARLFKSWQAGAVAAALLSADGFLISFSRVATLDGALVVGVLSTLLLCTAKWRWSVAIAVGLVVGATTTVKFSGVCLGLPVLTSLLLSEVPWKRRVLWLAVVGAVAAVAYLAVYALGLSLAGQPTGVAEVVRDSERLLEHHARLTAGQNPWVSQWFTWFLPKRPILMVREETLGEVRVLTMLGNLATWWAAGVCGGAALISAAVPALRRRVLGEHVNAVVLLLSAAVAFVVPWVLSRRDSYLYHFLPTWPSLVLLLAGVVTWLGGRARLSFLCVVLLVAVFYAPVWSTMPLSPSGVRARLFLESWR
jgi:dolichyl-phosphate-mannose--protein O-mannosyl transferase